MNGCLKIQMLKPNSEFEMDVEIGKSRERLLRFAVSMACELESCKGTFPNLE